MREDILLVAAGIADGWLAIGLIYQFQHQFEFGILAGNPAPRSVDFGMRFYRRFFNAVFYSATVIGAALLLGVLGYHFIAGFGWIDAVLNATMILTGMGPVGTLTTSAAKLFASVYALFSGFVFVTASGIILSPMLHRVLHQFHADDRDLR